LIGDECKSAVGQTKKMKIWPLGCIHAWYSQFVNLNKGLIKPLQARGFRFSGRSFTRLLTSVRT
jgi:hypothetical protein